MKKVVTVGEIIQHLKQYKSDVPFVVHMAGSKEDKCFLLGASVYDENAWYDDSEIPENASAVELLVLSNDYE